MADQLMHAAPTAPRVRAPVGGLLRPVDADDVSAPAGASLVPVVLLAAGFHALLLAARVLLHDGDIGVLVCVARERLVEAPYQAVHTGIGKSGYDGQFYYALAQKAPWAKHTEGIDSPPVRQLRVLYPALAWALTGGHPVALLWVLPLINVLAIALLTALAAGLARSRGLSPWWGALVPVAINVGMPALRDLTDVVSITAVCAVLVLWVREQYGLPLLLAAAAAVFARETNVVIVGLVLVGCLKHRRGGLAFALLLVLGAWARWVAYLWQMYDTPPFLPAGGHFTLPGAGLWFGWAHAQTETTLRTLGNVLALSVITLQLFLVPYALSQRCSPALLLAVLAGAALAILGGPLLYEDRWSFSRVFAWLPLALCLAFLHARKPWPVALMALFALGLPIACAFRT